MIALNIIKEKKFITKDDIIKLEKELVNSKPMIWGKPIERRPKKKRHNHK